MPVDFQKVLLWINCLPQSLSELFLLAPLLALYEAMYFCFISRNSKLISEYNTGFKTGVHRGNISMIYLLYPHCKTVVNWDRSEVLVSAGCHRRLHCHCQCLMAQPLDGALYWTMYRETARFSCSLPRSIFLFSRTHKVLHKKMILHLRAFMRWYK